MRYTEIHVTTERKTVLQVLGKNGIPRINVIVLEPEDRVILEEVLQ